MNYRHELKNEIISYINSFEFEYFLLLNFRRLEGRDFEMRWLDAQVELGHFYRALNNWLIGPRWEKPHRGAERVQIVAIPERLDLNPHCHCLVSVAPRHRQQFEQIWNLKAVWQRCEQKLPPCIRKKRGSLDLARLETMTDQARATDYCFKEAPPGEFWMVASQLNERTRQFPSTPFYGWQWSETREHWQDI